jgi:hypothetical protein
MKNTYSIENLDLENFNCEIKAVVTDDINQEVDVYYMDCDFNFNTKYSNGKPEFIITSFDLSIESEIIQIKHLDQKEIKSLLVNELNSLLNE